MFSIAKVRPGYPETVMQKTQGTHGQRLVLLCLVVLGVAVLTWVVVVALTSGSPGPHGL